MIGGVTCPACGNASRDGARFCDECGARLADAGGGSEIHPGPDAVRAAAEAATEPEGPAAAASAASRPYSPPEHLAARIRSSAAQLTGERKQVTVLFADVSGSMDLAEQIDPEVWREIMDRFFALLCDGVHRYEGTVVQFTGDGIMALFGAPLAYEDHAVRAGHAALRVLGDVSVYALELRRDRGLNFSVRIGLNSGEVVVGAIGADLRVDYTALGHTVGLAQRMEAIAEPGCAYLTQPTAALLGGFFELRELGRFDIKGVREPVAVFELAGVGRARSRLDVSRARGFSRFVGRDREMAELMEAVDRAVAGEGRVIAVVGEAGVGKSRLCQELVALCKARGMPVYRSAGAAHARSVPFHSALEMVREYFAIGDGDDALTARERVAGRLLLLNPELADDLPIVFDFLGVADPSRPAPRMDPEARLRRLLELIRRLVDAHSRRETAASLVEDLHWLDSGSEAFLETLVQATQGRRSLLVVNFRPEYEAAWLSSPHVTRIELAPLGEDAVDELLDHLLGTDESLVKTREKLKRWTSGNPFFIEEVVQSLAEQGLLAGTRGAYRLERAPSAVDVPASIQAVLAARIDRLDARDKEVVAAAAVVGHQFDARVLQRVAHLEPTELRGVTAALVDGGFFIERSELGPGEHAFRHPLTQEVAYRSQLRERRRQLHAAVAEAITEVDADRLDERAALVAQHWERAGRDLEAARWHARAGAWAGLSDLPQANAHWQRVRELTSRLPETAETAALGITARMMALQISWRVGMDGSEADALFAEGRALAERAGDEAALATLTMVWAGSRGMRGRMRDAVEPANAALEGIRRSGNKALENGLIGFPIYVNFVTGRLRRALDQCDRMVQLSEEDPSLGVGISVGSPWAWAYMMRGFVRSLHGEIREGLDDLALAVDLSARHGDLETAGWAHQSYALIERWSGESLNALEHSARAVDVSERMASSFSRIWARYNLAVAHNHNGAPAEAQAVAHECLELIASTGTARECQPWCHIAIADARIRLGDPGSALPALDRALQLAEELGVGNAFSSSHQLRARALRLLHGIAAEGEIEAAVEAGLAAAEQTEQYSEIPLLLIEAAELAALRGDSVMEEEILRRARARAEANGALGHVAALDERLAVIGVG